jgi:hypothetical protein
MTIKNFKTYKEFKHEYETKLVYTRKQVHEIIENITKENTVNRVIQKGKDFEVAMQILEIHKTTEGILIIVA